MFSAGLSKAPLLEPVKGKMARARNIKPGVFKNEILVELPAFTRLLFIGLWTLADREGRLEDRPKRIKLELFPYDSEDINAALSSLLDGGFIKRYEAAGVKVIAIENFLKHQNPHGTEKDSELPDQDGVLTVHERDKKGYSTGSKRANNVKSEANNVSPTEANVVPVCNNALNPDSLIPDPLINSVAKATADKSAEELTKIELWTAGKSILESQGMPKAQCGSFVGKLVKDYGDSAVIDAVRSAVVNRPADAAEYIKAICMRSGGQRTSAKPSKHTGFDKLNYREGVNEDGALA